VSAPLTPLELDQRLAENLRRLVADLADLPRPVLDALVDSPPRGAPDERIRALAEVAEACRPDLDRRGSLKWIRRQLRGGEMTWTRLAALCNGLNVQPAELFADPDRCRWGCVRASNGLFVVEMGGVWSPCSGCGGRGTTS